MFIVILLTVIIILFVIMLINKDNESNNHRHQEPDRRPSTPKEFADQVREEYESYDNNEVTAASLKRKAQEIIEIIDRPTVVPPYLRDKNPPQFIVSDLKGLYYRSRYARSVAQNLEVGERLYLEKDPKNKYDENAVKVRSQSNVFIGYIDSKVAEKYKDFLDWVKCAVITDITYPFDGLPQIKMKIAFFWTDMSKL